MTYSTGRAPSIERAFSSGPAAALLAIRDDRGAPLSEAVAARMAALLEHDFRHVRIHTSAAADAAARLVAARAFTVGADIFFSKGAYAPDTLAGERLLVHELIHVRQSDRGEIPTGGSPRVSSPGDAAEREARDLEGRAGTTPVPTPTPLPEEGHVRTGANVAPRAVGGVTLLRAPSGVINTGSSCFINAVLQVLAQSYYPLFDVAQNPVAAARRPIQALIRGFLDQIRGTASVPVEAFAAAAELRRVLAADGLIEGTSGHEDAHELMMKLISYVTTLEGRQLTVNLAAVVGQPGDDLSRFAERSGLDVDGLIAQNPGAGLDLLREYLVDRGVTRQFDPTTQSQRVSSTTKQGKDTSVYKGGKSYRVERDLSMVVVDMDSYDSLHSFLHREYGVGIDVAYDERNRHKGWNDGEAVSISGVKRTFAFTRLPRVITFALRRFTYDESGADIKLLDDFEIPAVLVLKEMAAEGAKPVYKRYALRGVIEQLGNTRGGHYIAHVNESAANKPPDWFTMDDSRKAQGSGATALERGQRAGYVYTFEYLDALDAPPKDAFQDIAPTARSVKRATAKAGSSVESEHVGSSTPLVGQSSTDLMGLPNKGRQGKSKSDCFINAIVQIMAGPYRDLFDPKKNPIVQAKRSSLQRRVWSLIEAIHKTDPSAKAVDAAELTALRQELMDLGLTPSMTEHEDASQVMFGLLNAVLHHGRGNRIRLFPVGTERHGRPSHHRMKASETLADVSARYGIPMAELEKINDLPSTGQYQMVTQTTREIDLTSARKLARKQDAGDNPGRYQGNKRDMAPVGGLAMIVVDLAKYENFHRFLHAEYGEGGDETALGADNSFGAESTVRGEKSYYKVSRQVEKTRFLALPRVVTFNLKRFKQDDYGRRSKDSRAFHMPEHLMLVEHGESVKYKEYALRGEVVHLGGLGGGHYVAEVQHQKQWYGFDDDAVTREQGPDRNLDQGYLYTYVQTAEHDQRPGDKVALQDQKPDTGKLTVGAELLVDFDKDTLTYLPAKRELGHFLAALALQAPVRRNEKAKALLTTTQGDVAKLRMMSAQGLRDNQVPFKRINVVLGLLKQLLGVTSLVDRSGGASSYTDQQPKAKARPRPRVEREIGPEKSTDKPQKVDLQTLSLADIQKLIEAKRLKVDGDEELSGFLRFKARQEFYAQLHLVYDVDQTLITYGKGEYTPSKDPLVLGGELALESDKFKLPVDGLIPEKPPGGNLVPEFDKSKGGAGWDLRLRPKSESEQRESTEALTTTGTVASSTSPNGVRAVSIRPGMTDTLARYHRYGVRQSLWTHNSDHHVHRILALLEKRGLSGSHFAKILHAQNQPKESAGKKPLDFGFDKPPGGHLTVLLDDVPSRGNPSLPFQVDPAAKGGFKPTAATKGTTWEGESVAELLVPKYGDASEHFRAKPETDDFGQIFGERLLHQLALALATQKNAAATAYLDAIAEVVKLKGAVDFDAFMKDSGEKALDDAYARFVAEPGAEKATPGPTPEDEPLFALTPSLGASMLLEKEKDKHNYVAHNIINRGLIQTEMHEKTRCVRVYQTEANPITVKQRPTTTFKDVHQSKAGALDIVEGKGAVCFGVGTPLRALKWVEKYLGEHRGKGFNPVIRSFLLPLEDYIEFSGRAVVQNQSSHERYKGKDYSTSVDTRGETDQYEMRDDDLARFKSRAIPGTLVSWALRPREVEAETAGDLRDLDELHERLGIPRFSGIFAGDYDPWVSGKEHRDGTLGKTAAQLGELYGTYLELTQGKSSTHHLDVPRGGKPKEEATRVTELTRFMSDHLGAPKGSGDLVYAERIARIKEEKERHRRWLERRGQQMPDWTDEEFFMHVLVPSAATQLMVTQTISDNFDQEREDLGDRHPDHMRSEAALRDLLAQGNIVYPPDTAMGTQDFARLRERNVAVGKKGQAIDALMEDPNVTATQLVDAFIKDFPELADKFDAESNPTQKYTFYDHAQMVLDQYLRYFRATKHPLFSPASMVKMILFHDMDKRLSRTLAGGLQKYMEAREQERKDNTYRGSRELFPKEAQTEEFRQRVPLSRVELGQLFEGAGKKDSEHVLPAYMMRRYAALWGDLGQAEMAVQMMNGDPLGDYVKRLAGTRKGKPLVALTEEEKQKPRQEAFDEIVAMATRAGIAGTDHARIRAFAYELLMFYQADSSSYSIDSSYHRKGDAVTLHRGLGDQGLSEVGGIYIDKTARVAADGRQIPLAAKGKLQGFMQLRDPELHQALEELMTMFDDVAAHSRVKSKAEDPKIAKIRQDRLLKRQQADKEAREEEERMKNLGKHKDEPVDAVIVPQFSLFD